MERKPGEKLGPYELVSPIGKGGMGEVWKARDTRLHRDVAIKFCSNQVSDRFQREARAIAALNHPNICHLYDVGHNYLVMELVEGDTPGAPLPLEEALRIAHQIADALEAAHEKGVVHRDLKPGNIKIKPDGTVKVLDFGLAQIAGPPAAGGPDGPTLTLGSTEPGTILGTAAYMSPEQARGKPVDKRADIWAYGVVLYEMVTGRRLFRGDTFSDTLASVLQKEPRWDRVPIEVRRLLQSCLQKNPNQRLHDIADAKLLLEPPHATATASRPLPWIVSTGALAIIAGIALWTAWRPWRPADRPLVRLDVDLGALPPVNFSADFSSVIISPDGTRIIYVAGNPTRLFTRRMNQAEATELADTEGASSPFFSPDGQWVGFVRGTILNKISAEGGAVVRLADLTSFAGASWGEDGSIFVGQVKQGVLRIPPGGGDHPETVTELADGEIAHRLPQLLPGGKAVMFVVVGLAGVNTSIEVLSLADHHRKILVQEGTSPHYLSSGHLAYSNRETLFAVAFDLARLEILGTAIPILDDVADSGVGGQFDFSRTGILLYRKGGFSNGLVTLQWLEPTGGKQPLRAKPGPFLVPRLSPDGKRVALMVLDQADAGVWVYDEQRDAMTRLSAGRGFSADPIWSPDGRYIVFGSAGQGILSIHADGADQPRSLIESKSLQLPWSFASDGKRIAYFDARGGNLQIWTVPVEDKGGELMAGKPEQFLKSRFTDFYPAFSPDGRWLAYESNESGSYEVYVRPFPPPASGRDGKWPISNSGGTQPVWSRNRHELLYQSGDQIMAVRYTVKGDVFLAEKPRVWISKLGGMQWDLTPDGKRVVVLTPVESAETSKQEHEVVFLENFFDELRRRVPTKN